MVQETFIKLCRQAKSPPGLCQELPATQEAMD